MIKTIRKTLKHTQIVNLWITKCLITSGGNSEIQQDFGLTLRRINHTFILYSNGEEKNWHGKSHMRAMREINISI